jgi:hypothetical protein
MGRNSLIRFPGRTKRESYGPKARKVPRLVLGLHTGGEARAEGGTGERRPAAGSVTGQ